MNKRHLVIRNLGPIKEIDIFLNRFNWFIGPQSSGKSTIAKVISTCEWIEKEVATSLNPKCIPNGAMFRSLVEKFHKINDYFDKPVNSTVLYETDIVKIEYENKELNITLLDMDKYQRQKISYIPSERNMISLPELDGFEFKNTSLKSFLFDWWSARDSFTENSSLDILNLGFRYYYDKNRTENKDRIQHTNGLTYDIALSDASSGLQSATPLFVMLNYYTSEYFNEYDAKSSFKDERRLYNTRISLMGHHILSKLYPDYQKRVMAEMFKELNERIERMDEETIKLYKEYEDALKRLQIPVRTSFIIEEPEQNLFPDTHVRLIHDILNMCHKEKEHRCTITTHSPYMLFALNNCMLAYLVDSNIEEGYKNELASIKAKVNPEEVSVWSLHDGFVCDDKGEHNKTIQDTRGLIRKNYFNEIMRKVMNEFNELLTYDN